MAKAKENSPAEAPRPERWSAQQKTEVILRLLRGEDLGEVSREAQVPAHETRTARKPTKKPGHIRPEQGENHDKRYV
jgi:hypothetical protein